MLIVLENSTAKSFYLKNYMHFTPVMMAIIDRPYIDEAVEKLNPYALLISCKWHSCVGKQV